MNSRFLLAFFLMWAICLHAQVHQGGQPWGLKQAISASFNLPAPDMQQLAKEDKTLPIGQTRFAVPIAVRIHPQETGTWTELPNGDRVWRLQIQAQGALATALEYQNFHLPQNARLYVYHPQGKQILGAYTQANVTKSGQFFTGLIQGDAVIVEYFEPQSERNQGSFEINNLYYAYRLTNELTIHESSACNVNINCPQGQNYATVKRGVARILMVLREGLGWCSGSLVANTDSDGKPYLLSAYHCQDGYTPLYHLWTFYFGYESPTCANSVQAHVAHSLQGCQQRAGWRNSDFLLLELDSRLPDDFNAYFNGWNRDSLNLPVRTAMIHHPRGDVQKVSIDEQASLVQETVVQWNNNVTTPAHHHLKVHFDVGTTEIGSSGAPLFDPQQRIVGQLNGVIDGDTNRCANVGDALCGRFSKSWTGGGTPATRLKDWLDPFGTNVLTLSGIEAPPFQARVSGYVRGYWGQGIKGVTVALSNAHVAVTDTAGYFEFEHLPVHTNLQLRLSKLDNFLLNGISIADIAPISRHILGVETMDTPKTFAADVNFDRDVNTSDMILIRRLVLRMANSYPAGVSGWGFMDENALGIDHFVVNFTGNVSNLNFIAFKRGDTNGSANGQR